MVNPNQLVLELTTIDQFIDRLLTEERVCDIILPRIMARHKLEELDLLPRRISPLEEMLGSSSSDEEEEKSDDNKKVKLNSLYI